MATATFETIKVICDGLAALFAFAAGVLWIWASQLPVGTVSLGVYADSGGKLAEATREQNKKIMRGARFNKWAAFVTGLAALAACASWTIQFFIPNAGH
jgi:hypothetical protein